MLTFNEEDFYSVDYESEKKKQKLYDPLGSYQEELLGRTGRLDPESPTGFNRKPKNYLAYTPEPKETSTESELAPMAMASPDNKEDYGWWRQESGYKDWLNSQNLDPNKMDDFAGNEMYTKYIAWKAQNPDGIAGLGMDVANGLGSVIQSISDTVSKVPGLNRVVKPVGSVLQFIGNLFDAPRNILAGAWAAVGSGHADEAFGNMWDALKFSVGATQGNEEGKYFSWMDSQLRNLTDNAKRGMTDAEHKRYMDSDDFRQTKRLWQLGGMVLDMVLDPSWLIGAGEVKALKATKEIQLGKEFLNARVAMIAAKEGVESTLGAISPFLKTEKAYVKIADRINDFMRRSDKLIDWVKKDEKFASKIGLDTEMLKSGKMSNMDAMELILGKYQALAKGDLKGFEYAMRFKVPFVNMAQGGARISPSIQPIVDAVRNKIGGWERGFLSVAGRVKERAQGRVTGVSEVNELMFRANKYVKDAFGDISKGTDALAEDAKRIFNSPDEFNNALASIIQHDPDSPISMSVMIPRNGELKAESVFNLSKDMIEAVMGREGVKEVHGALKALFAGSKSRLSQEVAAGDKALQVMGFHGSIVKAIQEANPDDIEGMVNMASEMGERVGQRGFEGTNYLYRDLTPEARAFLKPEVQPTDVMKMNAASLAPERMIKIYIGTDTANVHLQEFLFTKPADLVSFRELLAADPERAFMKMNSAIRGLSKSDPDRFIELTQLSDQFVGGKLLKMGEITPEMRAAGNVKPIVSQGSISLLNDLGKKGLIIEGYSGPIYQGGVIPIFEKIMNDEKMIEKVNSVEDIFKEGLYNGFLAPAGDAQQIADLASDMKVINSGIFRGFAVKDYLEKPLEAAMKGIMGVAEAEVPHNWLVGHSMKALEMFNTWWKVNIYLKNPAAQFRNLGTNRLMMMGDGISPANIFSQDAKDGRKIHYYMSTIRKYQDAVVEGNTGKMSALKSRFLEMGKERVNFAGNKVAVNELAEKMIGLNVSASGFMGDMIEEAYRALPNAAGEAAKERGFIDKVLGGKYNILGKEDALAKKMGDFGRLVEQGMGRNEYFLTLVNQKGWSAERAAARVNEIMIDYGRISKTESALRKYMIPFYTWQSRMIPQMLIKAIEQPAYFTKFTQFKNNMYNMLELDRNFAPYGEQASEGVPWMNLGNAAKFLSGRPLAEVETQYLSGEGWMPQAVLNLFKFDGLSTLLRPIANDEGFFVGATKNVINATLGLGQNVMRGGLDYVVSGITPTVKIPIENLSNYSFQFQRPLQTYPDQTIRYLGTNMSPKRVNLLKSLWGGFREVDDLASMFDKNTATGEAKFTLGDYITKHLGMKPYARNEIKEVNAALWEMRNLYTSNLSDAKRMVNNPRGQEFHAMNALMAYHGIKTLEWYKEFALEVRDKKAFILGIQQDISDIEEKLRNPKIAKKRAAELATQEYDLLQKLSQMNGDIDRI